MKAHHLAHMLFSITTFFKSFNELFDTNIQKSVVGIVLCLKDASYAH